MGYLLLPKVLGLDVSFKTIINEIILDRIFPNSNKNVLENEIQSLEVIITSK